MPHCRRSPRLFNYIGSKWHLTPATLSMVPGAEAGVHTLVSCFLGTGSFEYEYAMRNPTVKVVCYDIDESVLNYHRVALSQPQALYDLITMVQRGLPYDYLTREHYDTMLEWMQSSEARRHMLRWAAMFFIVCRASFQGKVGSYTKISMIRPNALLHLADTIPTNIHIKKGNAFDVLQRYMKGCTTGTILYLDPPYQVGRTDYYKSLHNMDFDHQRFSESLRKVRVPFYLHYDYTVRGMYKDFCKITKLDTKYYVTFTDGTNTKKPVRELFIRNKVTCHS